MASFLFNMLNHSAVGQRSLEDPIGIVGAQLRALGHKAEYWPANDKFLARETGINVIVEGFTPLVISKMAEAHGQGARFLILATEEPSEKGFNQGTQPEMVMRQKTFADCAPFIEGIVCLVPGAHVVEWYGRHAPAAYCELGYAPSLVRRDNGVVPDFDFGFYGTMSPRRLKLLKRLAKQIGTQKAVKIMADFGTQADRDREMRRARVIVQIRKFDEMGLVSSSRCNTALCLGRPVLAEPHLLSKPWDEIVRFSDSIDSFLSDAVMMRSMWKGVHAAQFDKFKQRLTPQACIGQALQKIGIDLSDQPPLRRAS